MKRLTKTGLRPGDRVKLVDGRSVVLRDVLKPNTWLIDEQYREITLSDIATVVSKPRANTFKTLRAF